MLIGFHNIHDPQQGDWTKRPVALTTQEIERFWSKVQRDAMWACWLWQASVTGQGRVKHGQFKVSRAGKQVSLKPHRIAWELTHGAIPAGLCVCHHCDVPRCCNPRHLFLGTQADNLNDARQKGRLIDGQGARTIPEAAYRDILLTTQTGVSLARKWGLHKVTISRIRNGKQGVVLAERILQGQSVEPQANRRHAHQFGEVFEPVAFRQLPVVGDVR